MKYFRLKIKDQFSIEHENFKDIEFRDNFFISWRKSYFPAISHNQSLLYMFKLNTQLRTNLRSINPLKFTPSYSTKLPASTKTTDLKSESRIFSSFGTAYVVVRSNLREKIGSEGNVHL